MPPGAMVSVSRGPGITLEWSVARLPGKAVYDSDGEDWAGVPSSVRSSGSDDGNGCPSPGASRGSSAEPSSGAARETCWRYLRHASRQG